MRNWQLNWYKTLAIWIHDLARKSFCKQACGGLEQENGHAEFLNNPIHFLPYLFGINIAPTTRKKTKILIGIIKKYEFLLTWGSL